jgi:hypothetical protein
MSRILASTNVNTLILNEVTNKYYLYSQSSKYIISITDNDCQSKQISNTEIFQNTEYIGNIFEGEFNPLEFYSLGSSQSKIYLRCTQLSNEIIMYGKIDNDVGFYFLEKDLMLNLGINCDVEDSFYCKKIDNSVYICVYLCNNKINVHFFAYATPEANANGNCEIKNISAHDGDEVVQVYAHAKSTRIQRPEIQLCAFERLPVRAGEIKNFSAFIPFSEFEIYDVSREKFCLETGDFDILIGTSSADIAATLPFVVE